MLRVVWNGVFLPPAANLDARGFISLPAGGPGHAGERFWPSGLLRLLALQTAIGRQKLPGFEKGNGWAALQYKGHSLDALRELAGVDKGQRGARHQEGGGGSGGRGVPRAYRMRDGDSSSGSEDVEDMDEDEAEDDLAGEASVDDDLQGSDDDFFPAALARKRKGAPGGGTGSSSSGGGGSNGGAAALGPAKRARPDPAVAPLEVPRCPRHARAVGGLRAVPSGVIFRTLEGLHEAGVHVGKKHGVSGTDAHGAHSLLLTHWPGDHVDDSGDTFTYAHGTPATAAEHAAESQRSGAEW